MKKLKRYLPLQISTLVPEIFKFEKCVKSLPWSQRLSFNIIFFTWKFATWSADQRKESLWSRSLRIPLSCWLGTWGLSKMSFSFDQSHPQRYLIHPIIWFVEQLKLSSNQKWRSKADGMKVRIQRSWPEAFFSFLSALCANNKNKRSGLRCKTCQERMKESLWDQGIKSQAPQA